MTRKHPGALDVDAFMRRYWQRKPLLVRIEGFPAVVPAANYRAVCRAKSDADFISKMGTVVEEADESLLWLELLEPESSNKSSAEREDRIRVGCELLVLHGSRTFPDEDNRRVAGIWPHHS